MAIFARRVIQRMLDENRDFLPPAAVEEHVRKLNRHDSDALSTEWEVFVLNRLRTIGTVRHEQALGGSSRPDVLFESGLVCAFLADIRAVSDRHSHKENPIDYFYECVTAYLAKRGPGAGGIDVQVDGKKIGQYGDQKVKLHLPRKGDVPAFVKKHFAVVARRMAEQPGEAFLMTVGEGGIHVQVAYHPGSRYFSGGSPSPSSILSLTHNPIYKSLKRKAEQLSNCRYVGVKGVFLCDAGCHALCSSPLYGNRITPRKIIDKAFGEYSTLSFVVVLRVEEKRDHFRVNVDRSIRSEFFSNPNAKCIVGRRFWTGLKHMFDDAPQPEATPQNALNRVMAGKDEGVSFIGGGKMSGDEVEIPSRLLTEILAGTVNYHEASEKDKGMLGRIA